MTSLKDRGLIIAIAIVAVLGGAVELWMRNRGPESVFTDGERTIDDVGAKRTVLWSEPTGVLSDETTPDHEAGVAVDASGVRIVYSVGEPGTGTELWFAERRGSTWHRRHLTEVSSPRDETSPCLSADGTLLYFASDRSGGNGGFDLYVSELAGGGFSPPENLGVGVNSGGDDIDPALGAGSQMLMFASDRGETRGRFDLYFAERAAGGGAPPPLGERAPWQKPVALDGINSAAVERAPALGPNGRTVYFASDRQGGAGGLDLYKSVFLGETWLPPKSLAALNTPDDESDPSLSAEGFTLYFAGGGELRTSTSKELFEWTAARNRFLSPLGSLIAILLVLLMVIYAARRWAEMGVLGRCVVTSLIAHLLLFLYFNRVMVHGTVRVGEPGESRYRVTMLRAKERQREASFDKRRGDEVGPTEVTDLPDVTRADTTAPDPVAVSAPSLAAARAVQSAPRSEARPRSAQRVDAAATAVDVVAPVQPTRQTRTTIAARTRQARALDAPTRAARPVDPRKTVAAPRVPETIASRALLDRERPPLAKSAPAISRAVPAPARERPTATVVAAVAQPAPAVRAARATIAKAPSSTPLRREPLDRSTTAVAAPSDVPLARAKQSPAARSLVRDRQADRPQTATPRPPVARSVTRSKTPMAAARVVRPAAPAHFVKPAIAARQREANGANVVAARTPTMSPARPDAPSEIAVGTPVAPSLVAAAAVATIAEDVALPTSSRAAIAPTRTAPTTESAAVTTPERAARPARPAVAKAPAPAPLRREQLDRLATEAAAPRDVPLARAKQSPAAHSLVRDRQADRPPAAMARQPVAPPVARSETPMPAGRVVRPASPAQSEKPGIAARRREANVAKVAAGRRPTTPPARPDAPSEIAVGALVAPSLVAAASVAAVVEGVALPTPSRAAVAPTRTTPSTESAAVATPGRAPRAARPAVAKAPAASPRTDTGVAPAVVPAVARATVAHPAGEVRPASHAVARPRPADAVPPAIAAKERPIVKRPPLESPAATLAAPAVVARDAERPGSAPPRVQPTAPTARRSIAPTETVVSPVRREPTRTPLPLRAFRPDRSPPAAAPLARAPRMLTPTPAPRTRRAAPAVTRDVAPVGGARLARPGTPVAATGPAPSVRPPVARTRPTAPRAEKLGRTEAARSATPIDEPSDDRIGLARIEPRAFAPRRAPMMQPLTLRTPGFPTTDVRREPAAVPEAPAVVMDLEPRDTAGDPEIAPTERQPIVARKERDARSLAWPRRDTPAVRRADAVARHAMRSPTPPRLAINARIDDRPQLRESPAALAKVERATGLYGHRTGEAKLRALKEFGGNEASERAVAKGLDYLARRQRKDGSWGRPRFKHHKYGQVQIGKSALALLAFLGSGHTPQSRSHYSRVSARAIDYLLSAQFEESGHIGRGAAYSHGIATYALAEAYAMTKDATLREPLERAVGRILDTQYLDRNNRQTYGGWGYYYHTDRVWDKWPRASVTAWQVMALKSATIGGIAVPDESLAAARSYLRNSYDRRAGSFRYSHDPDRLSSAYRTLPGSTPASVFALLLLGEDPESPRVKGGLEFIMRRMPTAFERASDMQFVLRAKGNLYFWYYSTLALFTLRGDDWQRWNARLRDLLVDAQNADGSWRPISSYAEYANDTNGDRSYTTALSVLMLEVYYRYVTPLLTYKPKRAAPESSDRVRSPGLEGAFRIRRVDALGAAARAGVRAGDHLHRYGGEVISDLTVLRELIREHRRSGRVSLEVIRNGRVLRVIVPGGSLGVTVEDR